MCNYVINISSVEEFQRWWVLKSKTFHEESKCSKDFFNRQWMSVRQKLKLENNVFTKKWSPKLIFFNTKWQVWDFKRKRYELQIYSVIFLFFPRNFLFSNPQKLIVVKKIIINSKIVICYRNYKYILCSFYADLKCTDDDFYLFCIVHSCDRG